jgi:hypothetical protein
MVRRGPVHAGLRCNAEGVVHRFALGAHHCRAYVLPHAAPGVDSTLGRLGKEAQGGSMGC